MSAKGTNYLKEIESRIKQTEDEIRHLKIVLIQMVKIVKE